MGYGQCSRCYIILSGSAETRCSSIYIYQTQDAFLLVQVQIRLLSAFPSFASLSFCLSIRVVTTLKFFLILFSHYYPSVLFDVYVFPIAFFSIFRWIDQLLLLPRPTAFKITHFCSALAKTSSFFFSSDSPHFLMELHSTLRYMFSYV